MPGRIVTDETHLAPAHDAVLETRVLTSEGKERGVYALEVTRLPFRIETGRGGGPEAAELLSRSACADVAQRFAIEPSSIDLARRDGCVGFRAPVRIGDEEATLWVEASCGAGLVMKKMAVVTAREDSGDVRSFFRAARLVGPKPLASAPWRDTSLTDSGAHACLG
jgi:hypothetical protein